MMSSSWMPSLNAIVSSIGVWSNRLLLAGIAVELAFAAAAVYAPPLQRLFGTATPPAWKIGTPRVRASAGPSAG